MATAETQRGPAGGGRLLDDWLQRLGELVGRVDSWARELGWATRRIEKAMEDSGVGRYNAPALLLQKEAMRLLLEPIARTAPGTEGVVDLYLMPAYDDVASLLFYDGGWQLHHSPAEAPAVAAVRDAEHRPLSRESLREVLDEMTRHAA